MRDQFTKKQFKIIDKYIDTLYKKYIEPWTLSAGKSSVGFFKWLMELFLYYHI